MHDFLSTTDRKIPILNSLPKEVIPNPPMQYLTFLILDCKPNQFGMQFDPMWENRSKPQHHRPYDQILRIQHGGVHNSRHCFGRIPNLDGSSVIQITSVEHIGFGDFKERWAPNSQMEDLILIPRPVRVRAMGGITDHMLSPRRSSELRLKEIERIKEVSA